uniref:Uncharacterized protein n=1 Tax=Crocodylus porosus TaxID=8502 RepID=A0A7M4DUP2_CROPO
MPARTYFNFITKNRCHGFKINPPLPWHFATDPGLFVMTGFPIKRSTYRKKSKLRSPIQLEPAEGSDVPDYKKVKMDEGKELDVEESDDTAYSQSLQERCGYSQEDNELREKEETESSKEPCAICQNRTSHVMFYMHVKTKKKKQNKPCPVCRQPIEMIVLTYFG